MFLYFLISGIIQLHVFILKKILLSFVIIFTSLLVFGQNEDSIFVIKHIIKDLNDKTQNVGNVKQLVCSYLNVDLNQSPMLVGLERKRGKWSIAIGPIKASIGRNGFALAENKIEGDGKTPTGLYDLGQLYSYQNDVNTKLPFQQVDSLDKWIDDSNSNDYNKYVRGETTAKSFEYLKLKTIDYKYCMVIEYNTNPVVKGKGSAIFFHVANEKYAPTAGCVAIAENDMLQFLKWFKPRKKKALLVKGVIEEND